MTGGNAIETIPETPDTRRHVSDSQIRAWLACPAKHGRERLDGRAGLPTLALPAGKAIHSGVEWAATEFMRFTPEGRNESETREIMEAAAQVASGEFSVPEGFKAETIRKTLSQVQGATRALVWAIRDWTIESVERALTKQIRPGWDLEGRLDCIAEVPGYGRCLVDFKSAGTGALGWDYIDPEDPDQLPKALLSRQAGLYAWMLGPESPEQALYVVASKKVKSEIGIFPVPIGPERIAAARIAALLVSYGIERGIRSQRFEGLPCGRCPMKMEGGCENG